MQDEIDLFTVKVFKVKKSSDENTSHNQRLNLTEDLDLIQEHPNMISARVIKVSLSYDSKTWLKL